MTLRTDDNNNLCFYLWFWMQTFRAKNEFEACNETVDTIANHPDLPFTLIYLASTSEAKSWDLISYSGLSCPQAAFPPIVREPSLFFYLVLVSSRTWTDPTTEDDSPRREETVVGQRNQPFVVQSLFRGNIQAHSRQD